MENDIICSICHDELSINIKKLSCNHIFHEQCINQWFSYNMIKLCPYCRKVDNNVNEYNLIWKNMNIDEAIQLYKNKYHLQNMTRNWILDKIQLINNTIPLWNSIIIGRNYIIRHNFYNIECRGIIYEKTDINSHGNFCCKVHIDNAHDDYFWSNICHFQLC